MWSLKVIGYFKTVVNSRTHPLTHSITISPPTLLQWAKNNYQQEAQGPSVAHQSTMSTSVLSQIP